jgi:Protein of unknown function/Domain of unknown function (DUF1835)
MYPTHIVFCHSAAKSLRDALAEAGRSDSVLIFPDDLSLGPINPSDWSSRAQWIAKELLCELPPDLSTEIDAFWAASLAENIKPVAWMSRRSTWEYANFLEWLRRMEDLPFQIIDLTEVKFPWEREPERSWFVVSSGLITSKNFLKYKLWDTAVGLPEVDRQRYRDIWRVLRAENAPLRILRDGELVSAPLDVFDARIMTQVSAEWKKLSRVVGDTLALDMDDECQQLGIGVLHSRLRVLFEGGALEGRGNLASFGEGEVRKAAI